MDCRVTHLIKSVLLLVIMMVSVSSSSAKPLSNKAKATAPIDWRKHFDAGYAAMGRQDYATAKKELLIAAAGAPKEVAAQYYLGLASAYANDYQTAQQAMSRVVVMTP